jgi:hypothetical protein
VHQGLQPGDLGQSGEDKRPARLRVRTELGADGVQPTLQLLDDLDNARVRAQRPGKAEGARGLVNRTEGLDPWVVFRRPATAEKARGPVVATPRELDEALAAPLSFRRRPG